MGQIALSFDNGPDAAVTPAVLEVLARRGVRASFFVLGANLQSRECVKIAERAVAEGHRIGNHSYNHKIPLGEDASPDSVEREIVATELAIGALACAPKLFRPFGRGGKIGPHLFSGTAIEHLIANRYSCILWNCVPEDWIDEDAWVQRALDDCATRPHTLVVMHDILPRAMSHLDRFIGSLLDAGNRITQEFPRECVPIEGGAVMCDIAPIVANGGAGSGA